MPKTQIRKKPSTTRRSEDMETEGFEEQGRESRRARGSRSMSRSMGDMNIDYKDLVRELYQNPTVRYLAGGVAVAMLNRFASRISDKYPEIGTFLRENIDSFEGRVSQLKPGFSDDARQH